MVDRRLATKRSPTLDSLQSRCIRGIFTYLHESQEHHIDIYWQQPQRANACFETTEPPDGFKPRPSVGIHRAAEYVLAQTATENASLTVALERQTSDSDPDGQYNPAMRAIDHG